MLIEDFRDKRITVMGLGLNGGGVGIARFLSSVGAKVVMTDLKSKEKLEPSLAELEDLENIEFVLGRHRMEDFMEADMVIKNPSVPWDNGYVSAALEKNVPVEMDSSLFFKLCKNPIIGVTGTRGKTTTSSLIYEILKAAGKKPVKVGIGQVSVLDKLNGLEDDNIVVFELSSWRLSALGHHKLSPQIAVITNIYPDHLNYYRSMSGYIADKKNIFLSQSENDVCVLNYDDGVVRGFGKETAAIAIMFSVREKLKGPSVFIDRGHIHIDDGEVSSSGAFPVLEISDIRLKGSHNLSNILAAVAVSHRMGIGMDVIGKAVCGFAGLPYRLEFVREVDGVSYYDDTTATSPEGAIAAINSITEKIVLIAGGSDKNLDMANLAKEICEKTKAVVFLKGAATDKIIIAMKDNGYAQDFIVTNSMEEAVFEARKSAVPGEVVLLSPGSASFGLFRNEFDRGDKFKESVWNLR
ncbi:MAG: UDP-N-acetylmuramoyl-L-alanine--D-glutamate ligase [bacterium]|nr:UDP-N-acetylmuramoyl-L-alanine--D-glutamate ligase [bacterium]